MSKSIMQENKECYITGCKDNLHKHHVIHGTANRKKAEKWGCWVWLRWDWHVMSDYCVHNSPELDKRLKRECQAKFEELYGHDKWMEVFGRNYLE